MDVLLVLGGICLILYFLMCIGSNALDDGEWATALAAGLIIVAILRAVWLGLT